MNRKNVRFLAGLLVVFSVGSRTNNTTYSPEPLSQATPLTTPLPIQLPRVFKQTDIITSVAFSPDGRYVLTGSADKTAILWDIKSGVKVHVYTGHTKAVTSVAFSPDGSYVLTGSADTTARLWKLENN